MGLNQVIVWCTRQFSLHPIHHSGNCSTIDPNIMMVMSGVSHLVGITCLLCLAGRQW